MPTTRLTQARALALLVPAALLGGAYGFQILAGLFPCEMCWWQRYAHMAAIGLAVLAFVLPGKRLLVALSALALATSAAIGAFHAGVEYGWWQGITRCTSAVRFDGGDPLAAIMNAPLIRCDVVQWKLFGVSLAGYNFLVSGLGALVIVMLLARSGKGGRR